MIYTANELDKSTSPVSQSEKIQHSFQLHPHVIAKLKKGHSEPELRNPPNEIFNETGANCSCTTRYHLLSPPFLPMAAEMLIFKMVHFLETSASRLLFLLRFY